MRFPYRPYAVQPTPAQPGVSTVYRPRIPIQVTGSLGELGLFGLLDTGADETVLPAFLIERIGVDLDPGAEAQFRGVGGQTVTVTYGRVQIEVGRGHQSYRWSAMLAFLQGSNMAILGHAGFLQYFTATFNGHRRHVTLTANGTLSAE